MKKKATMIESPAHLSSGHDDIDCCCHIVAMLVTWKYLKLWEQNAHHQV